MRRKSARPPNPRSLLNVVGALKGMVPSAEPVCTMRESNNGVPNLRYTAETRGIVWTVDIYLGHYYRVQVGGAIGEVFRTIPSLLGYLFRMLGVTAKLGEPTP